MSWTLRWVFILLPCVPGLTLLLAALGAAMASAQSAQAAHFGPPDSARASADMERAWQLLTAGSVVLAVGLGIGAFVAWRIAHPRPEPVEPGEDGPDRS